MLDFMFANPKRHIIERNGVFRRILRQNLSSELPGPHKKTQNSNTFLVRKVTHARKRHAWRIVTNFCTGVGVHDIITCADLYYDRLRGLGVAGGQILAFSIDLLRRPYNTLARCECVITQPAR